MYMVLCAQDVANFATLNEARAYAEKISWIENLASEIRCPDGKRITVNVNERA